MSVSEELGKLGELHQRGILTDEEFARAKGRILDGTAVPRSGVPSTGINALRRSVNDRWIGGVCGGLAQVTGLASWIWRLIFVLTVVFAGTGLLLYVLMWIFVPEEQLYLPAPSPTAG
jgi:phage shock protein PspC (stress-responsive transcriptional regulator)